MSEPLHVAVRNRAYPLYETTDAEHVELAAFARDAAVVCGTVDDLVTLVNRLCRRIKKGSPNDDIVSHAADYLARNNLHGSPLREG